MQSPNHLSHCIQDPILLIIRNFAATQTLVGYTIEGMYGYDVGINSYVSLFEDDLKNVMTPGMYNFAEHKFDCL